MEAPRELAMPAPAPRPAPADVRQRWRVTYRRRADAPPLAQREQAAAWEAGLSASGLPLAGLDLVPPRPRLVFAAPLSVGVPAEAELLDLFLVERRPVADVRERLMATVPVGHELVDVYDVWLGAPALSGQVAAADYLVSIGRIRSDDRPAPDVTTADVARGVQDLLAARSIERTRDKGGRAIAYDLRPLIESIEVLNGSPAGTDRLEGGVSIRLRTRFDPERGVGRPEEVVAALGEAMGTELVAYSTIRERLILAGDA